MTKLTIAQVMGGGRSKYNNRKVEADGIVFDSQAEYMRYIELCQMEAAGEIRHLKVHPVYELQPAYKHGGKSIRAISYEGDFRYYDKLGYAIVEDIKGGKATQTAVFKLKAKMFRFRYPHLELRIVEA